MKHHPNLFDANTLHHDTRLLFQLKLLLGTVCAYGGEIPLTNRELGDRLGTSSYRIHILLQKLLHEGVVRHDDSGTLFFERYIFVSENEQFTSANLYAKRFTFFSCPEFLQEERSVQRFVLHYTGKELVYLPGNFRWGHIDDLYGPSGLLNLRCRKEALRLLSKAQKYLHIKIYPENFQVTRVHQEWLDMGEVYSEGAELWVGKQLKKHRFCCDFITRSATWQLAKVMEDYYNKFDYTYASQVFDTALSNIQRNTWKSHRFLKLLYSEEVLEAELDEISAYFRAVMESAELDFAVQLSLDLQAAEEKQEYAEMHLFSNDALVDIHASVLKSIPSQKKKIRQKMKHIHHNWLRRFQRQPEWFIRYAHQIEQLPYVFLEIKSKIKTHRLQSSV